MADFVLVSVCNHFVSKISPDFDEIFGKAGRGPTTNRLDFGGAPDQGPDPEIIYCLRRLISLSIEDFFIL